MILILNNIYGIATGNHIGYEVEIDGKVTTMTLYRFNQLTK